MECFQVRYDSRVLIYKCKLFIRLATGLAAILAMWWVFCQALQLLIYMFNRRLDKEDEHCKKYHDLPNEMNFNDCSKHFLAKYLMERINCSIPGNNFFIRIWFSSMLFYSLKANIPFRLAKHFLQKSKSSYCWEM